MTSSTIKKSAFPFIVMSAAFFLLQVPTASAQSFTLLPGTKLSQEACKSVMDDYAATGVVPKDQDVKNAEDYNKTVDNVNKLDTNLTQKQDQAQQAAQNLKEADQAAGDCVKQHGAGGKDCSDLENAFVDAQNKNKQAQADADQAQKDFAQAQQQYNELQGKVNPNSVSQDGTIDTQSLASARDNLLGCAIKTGRISLTLVPYFITSIINFILALIGLVSVLFIVLGGYYYVFSGMTDDKDKGKKTITHALMGMAIAFMAWAIVNIILRAITG